VARAGIDGLATGEGVVVPVRVNRVASAVFRVTPPGLLFPLLRNHPATENATEIALRYPNVCWVIQEKIGQRRLTVNET
jgi:hypothetical protein